MGSMTLLLRVETGREELPSAHKIMVGTMQVLYLLLGGAIGSSQRAGAAVLIHSRPEDDHGAAMNALRACFRLQPPAQWMG